jgi:hypothetical protein
MSDDAQHVNLTERRVNSWMRYDPLHTLSMSISDSTALTAAETHYLSFIALHILPKLFPEKKTLKTTAHHASVLAQLLDLFAEAHNEKRDRTPTQLDKFMEDRCKVPTVLCLFQCLRLSNVLVLPSMLQLKEYLASEGLLREGGVRAMSVPAQTRVASLRQLQLLCD